MNLCNALVPKQPHKVILGVLDENAYIIMGSLDGSVRSFPDILDNTNLPKSSLYVTLVKLVGNDLVIRDGASYKLTDKGVLIFQTFHDIIQGFVVPQVKSEETQIQPKESMLGKFFSVIKKIFSR